MLHTSYLHCHHLYCSCSAGICFDTAVSLTFVSLLVIPRVHRAQHTCTTTTPNFFCLQSALLLCYALKCLYNVLFYSTEVNRKGSLALQPTSSTTVVVPPEVAEQAR
jgi:hypothetical protein